MGGDHFLEFFLIVTLLAGPTLVSLIYRRVVPGHRSRKFAAALSAADRGQRVEDLMASYANWPCPACKSLNRSSADRCYHCARPRDAVGDAPTLPQAPVEPIMTTAAISTTAEPPRPAPARRGAAYGTVPSTGFAPGSVSGPVVPVMQGIPVVEAVRSEAAVVGPAAVRAQCPLLGLAGDPRRKREDADDDHRCHAGSEPARIAAAYKEAWCLTDAFPSCLRYQVAVASRPRSRAAARTGSR